MLACWALTFDKAHSQLGPPSLQSYRPILLLHPRNYLACSACLSGSFEVVAWRLRSPRLLSRRPNLGLDKEKKQQFNRLVSGRKADRRVKHDLIRQSWAWEKSTTRQTPPPPIWSNPFDIFQSLVKATRSRRDGMSSMPSGPQVGTARAFINEDLSQDPS